MPVKINGATSGGVTLDVPAVAGTNTITLPAGTGTAVVNGVSGALVSDTAKASTSGTSVNFTGIPSWVKRITLMLSGVSVSSTDEIYIQLGDAGGLETTGYLGTYWYGASALNSGTLSAGFTILNNAADGSAVFNGTAVFTLLDASTNIWTGTGMFGWSNIASNNQFAGSKTLSSTLDRLSLVTSGTNTFDAGTINIMYE